MALRRKLLDTLNDKNEPLTKRIKFADNILKLQELPIQHRESFVLKWILNVSKSKSNEIWTTINEWLSSKYFKDLTRNDLPLDDLKLLNQAFLQHFNNLENFDSEVKKLVLESSLTLIDNKAFQQFYKYNLNDYCSIITSILNNVDEENVTKIISSDNIFHKYVIVDKEFHNVFLNTGIEPLVLVYTKFNSWNIKKEIVKIVQRCIIFKQFKTYELHLKKIFDKTDVENKDTLALSKNIISMLSACYNSNDLYKEYFRLVFEAFLISFKDSPVLVYRYFILLIHTLGFKVNEQFNIKIAKTKLEKPCIEKSLAVIAELFSALSETKIDLECKISNIVFKDFLNDLIKTLLEITENGNANIFRLLNFASKIHPLLLEQLLVPIGKYEILFNDLENDSARKEYEKFVNNLLNTFIKLHRSDKLVIKLLNILHDSLFESKEQTVKKTEENFIKFIGEVTVKVKKVNGNINNIFPSEFLKCFGEQVQLLTSSQVHNLFRSLLYHLENSIKEDDLQDTSENYGNKILFIEIVTVLLGVVMENLRFAEHTVTTTIINKFVKELKQLANILGKFGAALMLMEHNHNLMCSLLKLSYLWGEIVNTLMHYRNEAYDSFERKLDSNYSACNITYTHSYLNSKQWSLVMQRITNFGEKSCKQLMQKLCIQRLKAMFLFEENVPEDVSASILKNIALHFDDTWEDLLSDPFCVDVLLPLLEIPQTQLLGEYYLKAKQTNENFTFCCIKDSKILSSTVLYKCLFKIASSFKSKKSEENCFALHIISTISLEEFLNENLDSVIADFFSEFNKDFNGIKIKQKLNLINIIQYLQILQSLPICFLPENIKKLVFWFTLALRINLALAGVEEINPLEKCENMLIGLLQNSSSLSDLTIIPFDKIISTISNFVTLKKNEIFRLFFTKCIKREENVPKIKCGIKYLSNTLDSLENSLEFSIICLVAIGKQKSTTTNVELRQYSKKIYKNILQCITRENMCIGSTIKAYSMVLQTYFASDKPHEQTLLIKCLNNFIKLAIENSSDGKHVEESLFLFTVVLRNKKIQDNVPTDFIEQVWDLCKTLRNFSNCEEYSKLLTVLYEHISNKQFSTVIQDLSQTTLKGIEDKNSVEINFSIEMWKHILSVNYNTEKIAIWQENIEVILQKLLTYMNENKQNYISTDIIQFILGIINATKFKLTSPALDSCIYSVSIIASAKSEDENFYTMFSLCISILESLMKHRKSQILDRIPIVLQQYRVLLKLLCAKNSNQTASPKQIQELADCAHLLEKLTKLLVSACNKHLARISPYLIADILKEYELITLYPNVKIHLNNCLYNLLALCDQHSISYLLRVLSTASTEIFKVIYENYKKYYKFTGRV